MAACCVELQQGLGLPYALAAERIFPREGGDVADPSYSRNDATCLAKATRQSSVTHAGLPTSHTHRTNDNAVLTHNGSRKSFRD